MAGLSRLPEEPLAVGVVVDLEGEADPVEQALHRGRLGLGHRPGAAVGLARRDRGRALLVVAPVVREVAVEVDAVTRRDLAVAVDIPQVLAPEPLGVERVLVAVRVGHRDEPQLGRLEQLLDLGVVGSPALDVPVHQAAVDLGRDPLARMLGRAEEHRWTLAILDTAGALGELDRVHVAALDRRADLDELGDRRILRRGLHELVADAAGLVPGLPDCEPVGGLCGCELPHRLAALDPRQMREDSLGVQLISLLLGEDEVDLDVRA